jgi:hypothetical protein
MKYIYLYLGLTTEIKDSSLNQVKNFYSVVKH